jgi:hypothetical protein
MQVPITWQVVPVNIEVNQSILRLFRQILPVRYYLEHGRTFINLIEHSAISHCAASKDSVVDLSPPEKATMSVYLIEGSISLVSSGVSWKNDGHVIDVKGCKFQEVWDDEMLSEAVRVRRETKHS